MSAGFARAAFLTAALCLVAPFFARGAYYCTREGAVLTYERREADSGKLKWKHELSVLRSAAGPDGTLRVECSSLFTGRRGKVLNGGRVLYAAEVLPGGDVCADPSEALKSVLGKYLPGRGISTVPARSVLPAVLLAGEVLPDLQFSVSAMGMTWRVRVTERKVLRFERIVTPAGTFDCPVVSEHKIERGPGRNRETTALTWYAEGVGMVRHDTYDKSGRLLTSEVLKNIR